MSKNKIFKIYSYCMAALTAVCAVCLVASCVQIYKSGPSPFSVESVTRSFSAIAIPIYIFLAGVLGGIILWLISPESATKHTGSVDLRAKAKKLRARAQGSPEGEAALKTSKKEARIRAVYLVSSAVICIAAAIYPIIHILNRDNFPALDINAEIIAVTLTALPFTVVSFVLLTVYIKIERDSLTREINALTVAQRSGKAEISAPSLHSNRLLLCIRLTVLVVSVIFIVLGVLNGGANDVLQKAIRICTECIGLG